MFEGLVEKARNFRDQTLGRIALERYQVRKIYHVVNYHEGRDGEIIIEDASSPFLIIETPYKKIGPFNLPILDHDRTVRNGLASNQDTEIIL